MYETGVPALQAEMQATQSAYRSAGIELTLQEAPFNTVLADAYECLGKTTKQCSPNSTALSSLSSPNWTYVPIYYPDGASLFSCGAATNSGNYCNKSVDSMIDKTETNPTSSMQYMYQTQNAIAKDVPGLWFPNSAYQISAITNKVGGVTVQDSTGHIYPQTWWVKK